MLARLDAARRHRSQPGNQLHGVSAYELGTREPDLLRLLQYARVAGISTDVLIDDKLQLRPRLPPSY
jgi:hypothetical protein